MVKKQKKAKKVVFTTSNVEKIIRENPEHLHAFKNIGVTRANRIRAVIEAYR